MVILDGPIMFPLIATLCHLVVPRKAAHMARSTSKGALRHPPGNRFQPPA